METGELNNIFKIVCSLLATSMDDALFNFPNYNEVSGVGNVYHSAKMLTP